MFQRQNQKQHKTEHKRTSVPNQSVSLVLEFFSFRPQHPYESFLPSISLTDFNNAIAAEQFFFPV